jgi:tRNA uridine 5-carboxymethylaminomethyl modification enzyme
VLIEDLITNGVDEPYRMFTSRSEYRLLLRHDNADDRLEPRGRELGLVGDAEWERFNRRRARLANVRSLLQKRKVTRRDESYAHLSALTGQTLGDSLSYAQLALRPGVTSETIRDLLAKTEGEIARTDLETALADLLYSGYLEAQTSAIRRLHQHDGLRIPQGFTFAQVRSLSYEMIERLERAQPSTFGQARRLPGLTPAALSQLLVHLTASQQSAT